MLYKLTYSPRLLQSIILTFMNSRMSLKLRSTFQISRQMQWQYHHQSLWQNVLMRRSLQPPLAMMQVTRETFGSAGRPILLALSNPDSVAECTAEEAYNWSDGRAVYASGTTFPAFQTQGGNMYEPSQANNSLIFPGKLQVSWSACSLDFIVSLTIQVRIKHLHIQSQS